MAEYNAHAALNHELLYLRIDPLRPSRVGYQSAKLMWSIQRDKNCRMAFVRADITDDSLYNSHK